MHTQIIGPTLGDDDLLRSVIARQSAPQTGGHARPDASGPELAAALAEVWLTQRARADVLFRDALGTHPHVTAVTDPSAPDVDALRSLAVQTLQSMRRADGSLMTSPSLTVAEATVAMACAEYLILDDRPADPVGALLDAMSTADGLESLLQVPCCEDSARMSAATDRLAATARRITLAIGGPMTVTSVESQELIAQFTQERAYLEQYSHRWPSPAPQLAGAADAACAALTRAIDVILHAPSRDREHVQDVELLLRFCCGFDGSVAELTSVLKSDIDAPFSADSAASLRRLASFLYRNRPSLRREDLAGPDEIHGMSLRLGVLPSTWEHDGLLAWYMLPAPYMPRNSGVLLLASAGSEAIDLGADLMDYEWGRALAREVYPGAQWLDEQAGGRPSWIRALDRQCSVTGWKDACEELASLDGVSDLETAELILTPFRRRLAARALADLTLMSTDTPVADVVADLRYRGESDASTGLVGHMVAFPGQAVGEYVAYRTYRRLLEEVGQSATDAGDALARLRRIAGLGFGFPNVIIRSAAGVSRFDRRR
ncbi:MAG: hypothetical protein K8T90_21900 [Planctomycetes bacterium]|nr:hypothetical protein [Planctomycetota bacterium]